MGRHADDYESHIREIVERHFGKLADAAISSRPSSNQRFISVTVTVRAESRKQLDDLYMELTASARVLMAL
jgi:putative lipoic acid-binding regulatory protein